MIKEIKRYTRLKTGLPSMTDIEDALKVAKDNSCIVELEGRSRYGNYSLRVTEEDTLGKIMDKVARMI